MAEERKAKPDGSDGKGKAILETISFEVKEHFVTAKIFKTGLAIAVVKDEQWYSGSLDDMDEDDMVLAVAELKDKKADIIVRDASNIKFIVKGLPAIKLMVDTRTPQHEKQIMLLKKKVAELEKFKAESEKELHRLASRPDNNVVEVTVHVDSERKSYVAGKDIVSFAVNKKQPNTILLIQANICVHGESSAELPQIWTYGDKTVVYGQTENYHNNSGYGRSVPAMTVIAKHTTTGPQQLRLSWNPSYTPFTIINPNKSDHAQYLEAQTCSVYTVWELLQ